MIFILGGIRGAGLTRGGARAHPRGGRDCNRGWVFVFGLRDFFGLFLGGVKRGLFLEIFSKIFQKFFQNFSFFFLVDKLICDILNCGTPEVG